MSILSNQDYAAEVMKLAQPPSGEPFRPVVQYESAGDCLEFFLRPDAFRAERLDDLVTVYYSQEKGDIVGSLLKGISRHCKQILTQFPGFGIEIRSGRVKLVHIFRAKLWTTTGGPETVEARVYSLLVEAAEKSAVEAEFCGV